MTEPVLPPKYYLHNFEQLEAFVRRLYGHLLLPAEEALLQALARVPEDAKCLYLRMANRRHGIFWKSRLQYAELDLHESVWDALLREGLALPLGPEHASDYPLLLHQMTKAELLEAGKGHFETAWLRKAPKPELLQAFLSQVPFADLLAYWEGRDLLLRQAHERSYALLLFLYFGNRYQSMTEFVVRDVGHIRWEEWAEDEFTPYFQTRQEVDDKWQVSEWRMQFEQLRELAPPEEVAAYFWQILPPRSQLAELAHRSLDRLLLRLAQWLEQQGFEDEALRFYQQTERPPSRERQVRLLLRQGKREEALAYCRHLLHTYQNAEEKFFAIDLLQQPDAKRRLKSTTVYLKQAPECAIGRKFQPQVEQGVLEWYREQGYEGYHAENWAWRGLFGLVCWEALFDASAGLHHPFQRVPSDLHHPEFFARREASLRQAVALLDRPDAWALLEERYRNKEGVANAFVVWHEALLPCLQALVQAFSPRQLQAVLLEMARNLAENAVGLPDLFVFKPGEAKLVEVKSPQDTLSAQQLHWLLFMEEQGMAAQVMRVRWI